MSKEKCQYCDKEVIVGYSEGIVVKLEKNTSPFGSVEYTRHSCKLKDWSFMNNYEALVVLFIVIAVIIILIGIIKMSWAFWSGMTFLNSPIDLNIK